MRRCLAVITPILLLGVTSASAGPVVVFSNLGSGSVLFDCCLGHSVSSATTGADWDVGGSFIPSVSGKLDVIEVALFNNGAGANHGEVWLMTDDGGLPGTVVETFDFSGMPRFATTSSTLAVASSSLNPILQAGTRYWLVASALDDANLAWNANVTGDRGQLLRVDGGAWDYSATRWAPAFRVTSVTIPEPPITPCTYVFKGGSGTSLVEYCVSANGTLVELQAPAGQEHINVGQTWEGYVVCTGTAVQAWELSATGDGFGAPTVIKAPNNTGVTLQRSSAQFQLDQVFKLDTKEKDVTITMTLTNISASMIPDVRIARAYDPDVNNDFGDDLETTSTRSVWASDVDAVTLSGTTWGTPTETAVDTGPGAACSPQGGLVPRVTGDATLAAVTYRVGNMAPGSKKKVVFVYRVQ